MKNLAAWASAAALAACATTQGPPQYGYRPGEQAPTVISEKEFEQLTESLTDLYNQRATLGQLLRGTTDAAQRSRYASDIDRLNRMIAPLEYRLRAANRPVPGAPPY